MIQLELNSATCVYFLVFKPNFNTLVNLDDDLNGQRQLQFYSRQYFLQYACTVGKQTP